MPPDIAADFDRATTDGWVDPEDLLAEVGSVDRLDASSLDGSRISPPKRRRTEIARTLRERFGRRADPYLGDSVARPRSLKDLNDLVAHAIEEEQRLKIVGAARAHGVATRPTRGTRLVSTERLGSILKGVGTDIRGLALRKHSDIGLDGLVRVQAGVPVRNALSALSDQGRAIRNHGSGDFQSCVGAISTATHGTGIRFGSVASFVRSLVVVRVLERGGARVPRIELIQRSSGATRQAPVFAMPKNGVWRTRTGDLEVHPVFDDDRFFAHLVGMGAMGLVYSMTLSVRSMINLREWREPQLLHEALAELGTLNATHRHVELVIDPYPRTKDPSEPIQNWKDVCAGDAFDFESVRCQVVRRKKTFDPPSGQRPSTMEYGRLPFADGIIGGQIRTVLKDPAKNGPRAGQGLIRCTGVTGAGYVDALPEVLLLNLKYTGLGAEWAVPLASLEPALKIILEKGCWDPYVQRFRDLDPSDTDALVAALETHAPFFQGPSVRFVRGEGAWLAGSYEKDGAGDDVPVWAHIEVGFLGSPGLERIWRTRKRHVGLRPEDVVADADVDALLGKLKKADATPPAGNADWVKPETLDAVRDRDKRRLLRLFAAYERGRVASLKALQDDLMALCARPHQGLWHDLDWAGVKQLWGSAADRWRRAFLEANPAGTFDSALTDQWGIR
jgi:hypothetical protein